jgi:hypothetical protein
MIVPGIIGGLVCVIRLVLLFKNIWNESFGTRSGTSDQYFPKEPSRIVIFLEYICDYICYICKEVVDFNWKIWD